MVCLTGLQYYAAFRLASRGILFYFEFNRIEQTVSIIISFLFF